MLNSRSRHEKDCGNGIFKDQIVCWVNKGSVYRKVIEAGKPQRIEILENMNFVGIVLKRVAV